MRHRLSVFWLLVSFLFLPLFAFGNQPVAEAAEAKPAVIGVRWANHVDAVSGISSTRIVLDVSQPVKASVTAISSPTPKLVVTLPGIDRGKLGDGFSTSGDIIDAVSSYITSSGDTKMVIDVPSVLGASDYKLFTLAGDPKSNKPFRVVIDVNKKTPIANFKFSQGLKGKTIVIDPGHGGTDPGAVGQQRTMEKDITLAVAMQAKALLEKSGANVVMTRTDDRDVFGPNASAVDELKARANFANNGKTDVFVSIHINSATIADAGGTATYYYPKTQYDLMLAQNMQDSLVRAGGLWDRGVNSANFYVIKRTLVPAVLLELAFISNPAEEKLMNTAQFQQRMGQAIVQGLDRFFTQAAQ